MLSTDSIAQAEKELREAIVLLGKANSRMAMALSLENDATLTTREPDYSQWGTANSSGMWGTNGTAGTSGFATGGVCGYIAMAMNSVNLALLNI